MPLPYSISFDIYETILIKLEKRNQNTTEMQCYLDTILS